MDHIKSSFDPDLPVSDVRSHSVVVRQAIKGLLKRIGFQPHSVPFIVDKDLDSTIRADLVQLNLAPKYFHQAEQRLVLSTTLTHRAWNGLSRDIKVFVAKQMLYMFLIDDFAEEFMDDLKNFGQRFLIHTPQGNFLIYVESVPVFLRAKVGGSEILAHLVWDQTRFPEETYLLQYLPAIPGMMQFVDYVNDILSYYKEFVIADEKYNFVDNFAVSHELSHLQVLCGLAEYVAEIHEFSRRAVAHDPKLLQAFDQWVQGFIQLFTAHKRYHLVELFSGENYLPPYHEDS